MSKKQTKKIELANCNTIRFPYAEKIENDMFIIGNFNGVFGNLVPTPDGKRNFNHTAGDALRINGGMVIRTIQSKHHVYLLSTEDTVKYFLDFLTVCRDKGFFNQIGRNKAIRRYFHYSIIDLEKNDKEIIDCVNNRLFKNLNEMKFDNIIQNPPYNGSLHLDFLEMGLDLLSDNGRMVIIEPATWLINIRKYGKRGEVGKTASSDIKKYDDIKERIKGHVESVVIENLDGEFNIENPAPFSTMVIDKSKKFKTIHFKCCGEEKEVESLYDCNMIGDYTTIWSIFSKLLKYGDMMAHHAISDRLRIKGNYTGKNDTIFYNTFVDCAYPHLGWHAKSSVYSAWKSDRKFIRCSDGEYFEPYVRSLSDTYIGPEIEQKSGKNGGNKASVYGTKEEIENWRYNVLNLKIFRFIPISLIYAKDNNNTIDFTPWLANRKYTDEESFELFGFNDKEIKLIKRTVEKYERNSPWFKRYMCGPCSVDDNQEKEDKIISEFINGLNEKYA